MGHKDTVELLVQKGAQVDSKAIVSILFILRYLEKSILLYNYYHSSFALVEIQGNKLVIYFTVYNTSY